MPDIGLMGLEAPSYPQNAIISRATLIRVFGLPMLENINFGFALESSDQNFQTAESVSY